MSSMRCLRCVLLASLALQCWGQCNLWNACGAGFVLKGGAAGIACGAAPAPACSDAVCCDATCDNAGWTGCTAAAGFANRPGMNTILCGATAAACSTTQCCFATCINPGWPNCGTGFRAKAGQTGIVCGSSAADCSATACCDATCDNAGWGGCTTGYTAKATPGAIVCGPTASFCSFTTCCNAMCNNAGFTCPSGFTPKATQSTILCGPTASSCTVGACCDATCNNAGFSCSNSIGYVAKANQAFITCGATAGTCTPAVCCDATCSNPAFTCTAGFVRKATSQAITCGATPAACSDAACCDATCANTGWGGCNAVGFLPRAALATTVCGATAASCDTSSCCDATCANNLFACPTGYTIKATPNSIRCGPSAGSCTANLCCDVTCSHASFSCSFGFVSKTSPTPITCGVTAGACTDALCCDATCANPVFSCPLGWGPKPSANSILCGATSAACTTTLCCNPTLCGPNQRVLGNACVACPPGSTNDPGDSAAGADTSCDAVLCGANQYVSGHVCTACPLGSTNMANDDATGPNTFCDPTLCAVNQRVVSHACVDCPLGTTNDAGDSAVGGDTFCNAVLCRVNEHVINNVCTPCPLGTVNAANDDASGQNTFCDPIRCGADQRVRSHSCVPCPPGTTNTAGDDASGPDTVCDAVICGTNQRVVNHMCVVCPLGSTNAAGDQASGADTSCDPSLCGVNQRVLNHACSACPPGSTNAANDPATGPDTLCDAILCARNQAVTAHACAACPPGSTNAAGDDATGPDTLCDPTLCGANQRVANHVCEPCPSGSTNLPNDDATGQDTFCDPIYCGRDQHVVNHVCVPCPVGWRNAPNDDATGPDTSCNRGASVLVQPPGVMTSEAGQTAFFTVRLESQPYADVTIPISSSDTGEGKVSPSSLTFSSSNWGAPQTVTVSGVQDAIDDGDVGYTINVGVAVSTDSEYNGLDPMDVQATNTDDDSVGVNVQPVTGINTTEGGGTGFFAIALHTQPTGNVTIALSSSNEGEGTISPSTLVFTPGAISGRGHWGTPQTVTVTGVDDRVQDGNVLYTITTHTTVSTDPLYTGINPPDVTVLNIDDDKAGVHIIPVTALTTTEGGGSAEFLVTLTSRPTLSVNVEVTSSDPTEGTVHPNALSFTALDWNTAKTITVTGVQDSFADGNVRYNITTHTHSTDAVYDGINWHRITLLNIDDDTAGINVTALTSPLRTTEGGGTATFTVSLLSEPLGVVTVPINTSHPSEGVATPGKLTFTTNWNVPQTVTVTGQQDLRDDGDMGYEILIGPVEGAPPYSAMTVRPLLAVNVDDDTAGITVGPKHMLNTTEAGGKGVVTVVLNTQPSHAVTVAVTSSDHTEGTVSPEKLIFSPESWNQVQSVTVTGADDEIDDGDVVYEVITRRATSQDGRYDGLESDNVVFVNIDNDEAGILVDPTSGLVTTENGGRAVFTVQLLSEPTAAVAISWFSSDTSEGKVHPPTITFGPGSWKEPRTMTVVGEQDAVDDGDVVFTISASAAVSNDTRYAGRSIATVSVTNTEDDIAGITTHPSTPLVTSENGTEAFFTVVLNTQPRFDVTIAISSSDETEGKVTPSSLLFTSSVVQGREDWATAKTVTVTGVDDTMADGDVSYSVKVHSVTSTDSRYHNMAVPSISITNIDNDVASVLVDVPSQSLMVSEAWLKAYFKVSLAAQPADIVSCDLSSSDTTEATVSPARLTFTPSDWGNPITVTITGVNDNIYDGDVRLNIVTKPCVSRDGRFNGVDPPDVPVVNVDVDTAGAYLLTTLTLPSTASSAPDRLCEDVVRDLATTFGILASYITECRVKPSNIEDPASAAEVVTVEVHRLGPRLAACNELRGLASRILSSPSTTTLANRLLVDSTATPVGCPKAMCSSYGANLCASRELVSDAPTRECVGNICDAFTCCKPNIMQVTMFGDSSCNDVEWSLQVVDSTAICQPVTLSNGANVQQEYGAFHCDSASGLAYVRTGFGSNTECVSGIGNLARLTRDPQTQVFVCDCTKGTPPSPEQRQCVPLRGTSTRYATCGTRLLSAAVSGDDDDGIPSWLLAVLAVLALAFVAVLGALFLLMRRRRQGAPASPKKAMETQTWEEDVIEGRPLPKHVKALPDEDQTPNFRDERSLQWGPQRDAGQDSWSPKRPHSPLGYNWITPQRHHSAAELTTPPTHHTLIPSTPILQSLRDDHPASYATHNLSPRHPISPPSAAPLVY